MEELVLQRPTDAYAEQFVAFKQEFLAAGDSMDGTGALKRTDDPAEFVKHSREMEDPNRIPADRVPATQFVLIRKCDDRLVGMLQVRHGLNEYLEKYAGHIGYSVRPSERRRGYAREMLKMALPFCWSLGLDNVLVVCEDGNIGSERTILANGGVYESTVYEPDEKIDLKRFWIAHP